MAAAVKQLSDYTALPEHRQQLEQGQGTAEWISVLQRAVADSPNDPQVYLARKLLGDLHSFSKQIAEALAIYNQLSTDPSAPPDLRLGASQNSIPLIISTVSSPLEGAEAFDQYISLVQSIQDQHIPHDISHDAQVLLSLVDKSRYYSQATAKASDSDEIDQLRRRAFEAMRAFLDSSEHLTPELSARLDGMGWGAERRLYTFAETAQSFSEYLANGGSGPDAKDTAKLAVQALSRLLDTYPSGELSRNAGGLLVQAAWLAESPDKLVAIVKQYQDHIQPGHEFLSALRDVGIKLSTKDETIENSNQLLRTVISTEKAWFPDTYTTHVNYQWALIAYAGNMIRMGDPASAQSIIEELSKLEIQGEYLTNMFHAVVGLFEDRYWPLNLDASQANPEAVRVLAGTPTTTKSPSKHATTREVLPSHANVTTAPGCPPAESRLPRHAGSTTDNNVSCLRIWLPISLVFALVAIGLFVGALFRRRGRCA